MKLEYQNIFKVYLDIEEEKKEHWYKLIYSSLVLDVIDILDSSRKCWRLVGGVLVEKTCGEIIPTLKANVEMVCPQFIIQDDQSHRTILHYFII